jgi:protein TonB
MSALAPAVPLFAMPTRRPSTLAVVVVFHALALWAVLHNAPHWTVPEPAEPLQVSLISLPSEPVPESGRRQPVGRSPAAPAFTPLQVPDAPPAAQLAQEAAPLPTEVPATTVTAVAAPEPVPAPPPAPSEAVAVSRPMPVYPPLSRRLGEAGRVRLMVQVLADGRVGEVSVVESSGYARLDEAAIEAIRRWRFTPATRGGEPVASWREQAVRFSLTGEVL